MKSVDMAVSNPVVLSRRPSLTALVSLFVLTLRQHTRGWRLLVLALLFSLPSVIVIVASLASRHSSPAEEIQFALILNLIPHALAPLAALLYSAGIVQDEVEEQTLTYLLLRPIPKWVMYITKLTATLLMTSALITVFTSMTFAAIAIMSKEPINAALIERALKASALLSLSQVGYCGLFGLLGLLMRRSLLIGVAYIFLFEGILASLDIVVRRMTVMYYFRVLSLRWLEPASGREWGINLATAPQTWTCVRIVLIAGLVLAILGAIIFSRKEFRMKTPEGV